MDRPTIQNRPITELCKVRRSIFQSVGELDQLREVVRGANLEITQLVAGELHGMLAEVDLGASSIHSNRFSLPARGRGLLSADRWTFVVFPPNVKGRFNCEDLDSSSLLIYPPGAEFEGTIDGVFQDWIITASLDEIVQYCPCDYQGRLADLLTGFAALRPQLPSLDQLRRFAKAAISAIDKNPFLRSDKPMLDSLHAQLMARLSQALLSVSETRCRRQTTVGLATRCQIVRQAEDAMRENLDGRISLADLCVTTGVSERTLRRAFLEIVGMGPHAYLRVIRLNRIRADLEKSSTDTTTVTAAALRWGFTHQGRLSHDYSRFFGELPSQTLNR